jgi:hypothetical protein
VSPVALLAALALTSAACGSEPAPPSPAAPLGLQGDVVIEPPILHIGQTATVEVVVVTPPDHSVAPALAPVELAGLWVLEAEPLPVQRDAQRWIHRTQFRVRARATGSFRWPEQTLRVDRLDPDGAEQTLSLTLPGRSLQVLEVAAEWPDRREPFGFRRPPAPAALRGALLPALAGAGAALAAVGLVLLVRRVRRAPDAPAADPEADPDAWRAAQATLAAAEARSEQEPEAAATLASAALRHYLTRRFRVAADSATTEELAARQAPWGLARSWPRYVARLRDLDAVRFRPRRATGAAS